MIWLVLWPREAKRGSPTHTPRFGDAAIELSTYCQDTLNVTFDGGAWLRRRFPAGSLICLKVEAQEVGSVVVGRPHAKGPDGVPKEIRCPVGLPLGWFAEPGDGLLAVRMMRACVTALATLGDHYEIGMPALRSSRRQHHVIDPFVPRVTAPSPYTDAARTIDGLAAGPGRLLVVAKPSKDRSGRQRAVAERLGQVEAPVTVRGREEKLTVWPVRQH
ncbi:hypothetical protein [Asanoa siamensis]|uniref:THUMP-like domain-containing protein n=1 Tax=Asanoa siamensis TaxID=926357 RepID=A0ABQ4CZ14_9ACTN|nr:hypothetical protein [Asanoa siamensis]GIF76526.1 hypothetical protein Asi02nite_60440 [Asanoa siamensis]